MDLQHPNLQYPNFQFPDVFQNKVWQHGSGEVGLWDLPPGVQSLGQVLDQWWLEVVGVPAGAGNSTTFGPARRAAVWPDTFQGRPAAFRGSLRNTTTPCVR